MAVDYKIYARVLLQDRFSSGANRVGSSARNMGLKLGAAGASAFALKEGLDFVVGSGKKFAEFSSSLSEVQAITGASADTMGELKDEMLDLAQGTRYKPDEVAQAMKFLGLAGFETNEILKATPGLLDLAAASGSDLATTSDIISDNLSALGMTANETNKLVDIFAETATSSNTSVLQLGEAMSYAGSTAKNFGLTASQTAAAIGIMGDNGIKASRAGTAMRGMLNRLIKPSAEASKALKDIGVTIADDGNIKDFGVIIEDLQTGLGKLTEARRQEYVATIFGQVAMSGANALLDTSVDKYKDFVNQLDNSTGSAGKMADVMQDNLEGAMTRAESAVDVLQTKFGETFGQAAKDLINDFANDINENSDDMIKSLDGVSGAINGILTSMSELILQKNKFNDFMESTSKRTEEWAKSFVEAGDEFDMWFDKVRDVILGPDILKKLKEGQAEVSANLQPGASALLNAEVREQQDRRMVDVLKYGTPSIQRKAVEEAGGIERFEANQIGNLNIPAEAVRNIVTSPVDIEGQRLERIRQDIQNRFQINFNVQTNDISTMDQYELETKFINPFMNEVTKKIVMALEN